MDIVVERPVYRHPSGMGSVLEFSDTTLRKILVLDSAYRDVRRWGAYGVKMPQLTRYSDSNTRGDWYLNTSGTSNTNAATVMPDAVINSLWKDSIDNKTAKENCDIWISQQDTIDPFGIIGVPAVAYARSILVDGVGCDIPNIQTLMRIYLEADRIDQLDPTVKDDPTKALGSMNQDGYWDCMCGSIWDGMRISVAWASSEYSGSRVRCVGSGGGCHGAGKNFGCFVVPIQEL